MIHPATITSYCLGTTSVKFWQFSVGTLAWIYKNTFKIYISCLFYEMDFTVGDKNKEAAAFKKNVTVVMNIIVAITLNICLAIYCKFKFDEWMT